MNRSSVRYQANPRFLGDDVRLRFGGSDDAALVYDSANDELTLQTTDAAGDLVDRLAIRAGTDTPVIVFNEGGLDADLRIEGAADPNLLFLDAGSDAVVFGGAAPDGSEKVKVVGDLRVDGDLDFVGAQEVATTAGNLALSPSADLILNDGKNFIGDAANARMAVGLTINQGANDDEILSLKSSDVGHSATSVAEADTYGYIQKVSAVGGGVQLTGISDANDPNSIALQLMALSGANLDTTKSTAGKGAINIWVGLSTAGNGATPNADGNLVSIGRYATWEHVWILDEDGDTWQSGGATFGGDLDHDGSNVGFYDTAPAARQTVTGSRGGNAALQSLLTALSTIGLITDSSTA